MLNKPPNPRHLLAKIDVILPIKTLHQNLINILHLPPKTLQKLDNKVISLVKTIDIAIDASICKTKLYLKSIPGFDVNCKVAQMRARRLKKI